MSEIKNLGIANVKVQIGDNPPYITQNQRYSFDIGAYQWSTFSKSSLFYPLLTEVALDEEGASFGACFPSKRKFYLNNFIGYGSTDDPLAVLWSVMSAGDIQGTFKEVVGKLSQYDAGQVPIKVKATTTISSSSWVGPVFENVNLPKVIAQDDALAVKQFVEFYGVTANLSTFTAPAVQEGDVPSISHVYQSAKKDGLWWGIKSNGILSENMPFWVNISKPKLPPTSAENPSYLVIRFGESDTGNTFDIWVGSDSKPRIIDYVMGEAGSKKEGGKPIEFDKDLSRISSNAEDIEVGVMVIAGRLAVTVNNNIFIYTRIAQDGTIMECKIPAGYVSVMATNISATVNLSAMSFAPIALVAIPVPDISTLASDEGSVTDANSSQWQGVDFLGNPRGSVCDLPDSSGKDTLFGCDCETFGGEAGTSSPKGKGYQSKGSIYFHKSNDQIFTGGKAGGGLGGSTYFLAMISSNTLTGTGATIPYGGAPFFFRLKGLYVKEGSSPGGLSDVSNYVMSCDETASSSDYFSIKKQASVTFYNPNNIIGNLVGATQEKQKAISISWGWNNEMVKTFTGIITNVSTSHVAGKETLTINAQDYMYILSNKIILNSPFYDGMVAFYALKDLAQRGGCIGIIKDWESEKDYFLPSGYTYTQPAVRFPPRQSILECMLHIVKKFEGYMYFDGEGILHIERLEDGLFSTGGGSSPVAEFSSGLDNLENTILGERTVDVSYESTVNCVSILTLDRNTRNPIIVAKGNNYKVIPYNKIWLIDQPAYGERDVAKAYLEDVIKRVFHAIIKTKFSTAGANASVRALDFVTVDGQNFRVTSVKRSYNADSNDFKGSYECEWLQGDA
jgi:hypothetical protein